MGLKMPDKQDSWDRSSHPEFFDYYAEASLSDAALQRFRSHRDIILALRKSECRDAQLDVADIGTGAGSSAMIWAELGHRVTGLDINEPLINLARQRAKKSGLEIRFDVGSATDVPWAQSCVDVCLAPELLEHVVDWEACLDEFARILRPGGILFLSTTNKLCPKQHEFNLPLYSWYPVFLKKYYERTAQTTRPSIANYAKYPAVNWFTFYALRSELSARGFDQFLDRFDIAAMKRQGRLKNSVLQLIQNINLLRWLGYFFIPGTTIIATKSNLDHK